MGTLAAPPAVVEVMAGREDGDWEQLPQELPALLGWLGEAQEIPVLLRRTARAGLQLCGAERALAWKVPSGPELVVPQPGRGGVSHNSQPADHGPDGSMDVVVPLMMAGRQWGQLVLQRPARIDERLYAVAAHAACCLAYLESCQQMRRTVLQLVTAFSKLVEVKDYYTEAHSLHIAELALQVGLRLGLSRHQLDQLTYAALLHDIGKIGIPDAVLHKPGPLSSEEWALVRRHPSLGRMALEEIDMLREAALIVEQHHERFDGSGYPHGLAGDAIRIEARIIAVVDAYDAMVSARPYRRALSREEALEELRRCAGRQFDPRVVEALVSVVGEAPPGDAGGAQA